MIKNIRNWQKKRQERIAKGKTARNHKKLLERKATPKLEELPLTAMTQLAETESRKHKGYHEIVGSVRSGKASFGRMIWSSSKHGTYQAEVHGALR